MPAAPVDSPLLLAVRAALAGVPADLALACSGGVDSMALLDAARRVWQESGRHTAARSARLRVLHVHHGLQAAAADFAACVEACCRRWQLPCDVLRVKVDLDSGEGLEAAARRARYAALAQALRPGETCWLAHHADDQAETLLLQLLRGAGLQGAASMAPAFALGAGQAQRPLLALTRAQLLEYAQHEQLSWVDDPSNADTSRLRNFLRHDILPRLRERLPAASQTLARSAGLLAEAARREMQAHADLPARLPLPPLRTLPADQAAAQVRQWLRQQGRRAPAQVRLQEWLRQLRSSTSDRIVLNLDGAQLRVAGDALCLTAPLPPLSAAQCWPQPRAQVLPLPAGLGNSELLWTGECPLPETLPVTPEPASAGMPGSSRAISQTLVAPPGILLAVPDAAELRVCFQPEHASVELAGRGKVHWQQLCREWRIPTWLRAHLPLLCAGDALLAVWPFGVTRAGQPRPGTRVGCWQIHDGLLAELGQSDAQREQAK